MAGQGTESLPVSHATGGGEIDINFARRTAYHCEKNFNSAHFFLALIIAHRYDRDLSASPSPIAIPLAFPIREDIPIAG